jgi:phosphatidylglycerol lysyltransferase
MNSRILKYIGPVIALFLFSAAVLVLHRELKSYHYYDIIAAFRSLHSGKILLASALTLLSYTALASYDVMAIRYLRHPLAFGRTVFASMISYALSNNIGISILSASAARYRIYSLWGLTATEITKILVFVVTTFWMGYFALSGAVLLFKPMPLPGRIHVPFSYERPIGAIFAIFVCTYLLWCVMKKSPIKIRGLEISPPAPGLALSQVLIATVDWVLAASVLYVLLPSGVSLPFSRFVGIYLTAQLAGMISHVPGGLGVFETVIIIFLSAEIPASSLMGSLLAYRAVYYLLPLVAAIVTLGTYETVLAREKVKRATGLIGRWVSLLVPHMFALLTFIGGGILLFSGATPAVRGRMEFLKDILPLPVMEVSHLLGSLAGAALVLLSRSIQRRVDAAYFITLFLIASGAIFSLLKGLDYEEAIILTCMFFLLLPCRKHFYRKASLFSESFTWGWITAIILILSAFVWIGLFSYKHVEYTKELWWRFAIFADAPRFLRAAVAVISLTIVFALAKLLGPSRLKPAAPDTNVLEKARSIISGSRDTSAWLALLGDKSIVFSESGNAFIMYGIEGRSWVAMGDPAGNKDETVELIWHFREMCEKSGAWTVFYEVKEENLPYYLDTGLAIIKIGEEGRTLLSAFSLEGSAHKQLRHVISKLDREGSSFDILQVEDIPSVLPEFRTISDTWLNEKKTREKGFSLGFYSEDYLKLCPAAIVRLHGKIVAFANIWIGAEKNELSIDLMRYLPEAPSGVMDYLFTNLMLWGKQQGFRWFNLGMAPFSGFEERSFAPLWNRLGALIFRYGEHFYNFQGIRQYKNKFSPVWRPKYIASPGGLVLPRVLTNVASLVSRGLKGVVAR